jgi:hypothetical protein
VVAGPVTHQHDVVVAVDQARDRDTAAQVDRPRVALETSPGSALVVADVDDLPVLDGHRAGHPVAGVHRVDAAVVQHEIGPERAFLVVLVGKGGRTRCEGRRGAGCPAEQHVAPR